MTAKMEDVILRSGEDPSLVQRVLGAGIQDIGIERISRILEAAADAGYTAESRRLGIVYEEKSGKGLTHPFFVLILDAFHKEAEARGYTISFVRRGENEEYADACMRNNLAGVCLVCAEFETPEVEALIRSGIPCVTVDHMFKRVPAVLSDNENGIRKLVEYAIQKGHRKIAFVHGHNNSIVTRTRIIQFNNVMNYYKLPVPPEYIRECLYDNIPLVRKIIREMLSLPDRPTCILLPDDISYLGAQDAATKLGLRIPDDISFMGYDGIPLIRSLEPKLTTIRQSAEELGQTAAARLIDRIEHPKTAKLLPAIFPVELLEGETVKDLTYNG
ncbi:MAG: substrate-binding domain-containing protein [Solobacterium sp.]|nr:substrate-binding domain-containing protein [Solobacterium sp.]